MMYLPRAFALAASALLATPAVSQEIPSVPLDGVFRAEPCADAPDRTCRFFQELRGEAARVLFEGIRSEAKPDECTGGEVKIDADTLRCFKLGDGRYLCDFGFDFGEKKFVFGDVTC
jgi:hypothetical protein